MHFEHECYLHELFMQLTITVQQYTTISTTVQRVLFMNDSRRNGHDQWRHKSQTKLQGRRVVDNRNSLSSQV